MTDTSMIADLTANPALWIWVIIIAACIFAEIATLGLTTIWFAGGAGVALVVSIVGGGIWVQIIVFIIVSVVLMFLVRPYAKKRFNSKRTATNVDSILGQTGIVIDEINNLMSKGLVKIGGQEWTARSMDSGETIGPGEQVVVERIEGVKVIVRKKEGGN
jgi:membrane protein implicated in regulation of membrane protease activity